MPVTHDNPRPAGVVFALRLLWGAWLLGFAMAAADVAQLLGMESWLWIVLALLAVFALSALLVVYISEGRGWARWCYLGLFLLGRGFGLREWLLQFVDAPILGLLVLLQILLQVAALVMLFRLRESREFFMSDRAGLSRRRSTRTRRP